MFEEAWISGPRRPKGPAVGVGQNLFVWPWNHLTKRNRGRPVQVLGVESPSRVRVKFLDTGRPGYVEQRDLVSEIPADAVVVDGQVLDPRPRSPSGQLRPDFTGEVLAFIVDHPGCTASEITDGVLMPLARAGQFEVLIPQDPQHGRVRAQWLVDCKLARRVENPPKGPATYFPDTATTPEKTK